MYDLMRQLVACIVQVNKNLNGATVANGKYFITEKQSKPPCLYFLFKYEISENSSTCIQPLKVVAN